MSWFRSSWNFICEISRLYKINLIIRQIRTEPSNITEESLERLRLLILEGGSIYIKFAQWFVSHISYDEEYSKIVDYFYHFFENCPSQSIEESDRIYAAATHHELKDDIDMTTISEIGSGSIGTVYKATALNGTKIAIKIKHPQINREIEEKRGIISIIHRLQNYTWLRRYFNLCFDLDDFINNIYMQTDFNIEAFNIEKMRKNFEDNKCIAIPRVLFSHENVLITEFIDTISLDELGDYDKHLVAINLVCLIYQMTLVDNFVHGDLHCKNWKIRRCPKNGNYQIVLFDMGICFNIDNLQIARMFWDSLENGNTKQIVECIREMCISPIPLQITAELDNLIQNISNNKVDALIILPRLINYFASHNLKIHPYAANILIMVCLIQKFLKHNGFVQEENQFRNIFSIIQSSRIDILSFCECYKSYQEVASIMREKLAICQAENNIITLKLASPDDLIFCDNNEDLSTNL
jgi:predicted unusual protein kinase regulating ubiquinone biosynthesis (AarF/ABC1/UbiB family)